MAHFTSYTILATTAACGAIAYFALRRRRAYKVPLPPGPPSHFILGNAAHLPAERQWEELTRMGAEYGPVMCLRLLTEKVIVLNTLEAATELLDRRGGIYSDRPTFPMLCDLMGWGWVTSLIRYGPAWREGRRVLHHFFHEGASLNYRAVQTAANLALLRRLLDSPEDFMQHIRTLGGASILALTYGIEVRDGNNPWLKLGNESLAIMTRAIVFGTYAVDWLPILKHVPSWFPGAGFKITAQESRKVADRVQHAPLQWLKAQMQQGKIGTSLAETLLRDGLNGRPASDEVSEAVMATVYLAGSDTTVAMISAFVLCMVLHPEAQKNTQEELDRVLGHGIMPAFEDRDSLPYGNAVLLEVIRLYPVLPLGVVHRAMEEDEYEGMRIPEGATILPNVWSILRDNRHYSMPEEFMPERYLKDGVLDLTGTVPDPRQVLFGFGRRICPGRHFADAAMWLAVATILACFDIVCAKNADGDDIVPCPEFRSGAVIYVAPFPCVIKPRSEDTRRMLVNMNDM